jgi:hypothetical protein
MSSSLQRQREIARLDSAHHEQMLDSALKALELLRGSRGLKAPPPTGLYLLGAAPSRAVLKTCIAVPSWGCTLPRPDWTSSRTLELGGAGIWPRWRRQHCARVMPAYHGIQRRIEDGDEALDHNVVHDEARALGRCRS